jgi:hypothetical protein
MPPYPASKMFDQDDKWDPYCCERQVFDPECLLGWDLYRRKFGERFDKLWEAKLTGIEEKKV